MKIFNTLSGQKEKFSPQGNEIKMYVCGVTPYSDSHIGHAMSYVIFDVIRRYLKFRGYKIKYVQNITDIDDKIINRSAQLGISTQELVKKYVDSYFEDMDALNVSRADVYPKATEEVPKIIEIIKGLIDKGYAYPSEGSVYFRVRNVPDYGKLSHRTLDSMMAGVRIESGSEKEHPMDFVLWKAAKSGEPSWDSPWGPGRSGWHIECSAMSLKYLGQSLDIHGGGQDLIFPHHENEIAQSEGFTGVKPFVKYWLHNGLVQLGEEKMSKSLGNLVTIKEALGKFSADALRIFILSSHYRGPLTFSEAALEAAEKGAERLRQVKTSNNENKCSASGKKIDAESYRQRFIEAMDDDFNTAQAIATLFDLTRDINRASEEGYSSVEGKQLCAELMDVLGLTLKPVKMTRAYTISAGLGLAGELIGDKKTDALLDLAIYARNKLRDAKQWKLADNIRSVVGASNIKIDDTPEGPTASTSRLAQAKLTLNADDLIKLLTSTYNELLAAKQWQLANEIRTKLEELGVTLEDTPNGTVWKHKQ